MNKTPTSSRFGNRLSSVHLIDSTRRDKQVRTWQLITSWVSNELELRCYQLQCHSTCWCDLQAYWMGMSVDECKTSDFSLIGLQQEREERRSVDTKWQTNKREHRCQDESSSGSEERRSFKSTSSFVRSWMHSFVSRLAWCSQQCWTDANLHPWMMTFRSVPSQRSRRARKREKRKESASKMIWIFLT